ncbi:MAG: hypothetical protein KBS59_00865, partial [Clostridiales bacterium]|nr:hypothetical protein [Clostridiales bacterium]
MKNPLIPMGAITTSMTKAQIKEMMTAYKEAGIEQYLFYARGGCDVEFMSDEWLDICENIVNEAEALGIDIWLYDEYDCPSGTCHGKLFEKHPEYKAATIHIENGKYEIFHGEGYLPMVDVTNPDAVDEFIKMTYEKLYARLGDRFGSVIKGVFSDEPSFCFNPSKPCRTYPYSDGIENEYKEKFGGDLFDGLISDNADCLENYFSLIGEKFRKSYIEKIASWCAEHGVVSTGHLLEEQNMKNAVLSNGNVIRDLRAFGMPGMDEIRTEIGDGTEWITLGSIQAARKGINGALTELFALGPCDMPVARLLQMIDLTALFGVDHYVLAVSAADA